MSYFILTTLIALIPFTWAIESPPEKVFSCKSQHSLFDPDFIQGSEIYINIFYDSGTNNFELVDDPAEGSDFVIFSKEDNVKNNVDLKNSTILLRWEGKQWSTYTSMVYLGGPWGMATKVPKGYPDKKYAEKEYELSCQETPAFEKYFGN